MLKLLFLYLSFMLFLAQTAFASVAGEVNKANDLARQGKIDDSLKIYQDALGQDAGSPVIKYDLGTALYKKGDYEKALGYLQQAAQDKNLKIRPKAEYNLGNALYKSGVQKEDKNVDEAIRSLQDATGHYGQTIAVDPKDQDAVYNRDFVEKEIERLKLKKQQQQQNQQQENRKQQQQQQQQSQENKQQGKSQQAQENQSQQGKQSPENKEESQSAQTNNAGDQEKPQSSSESQAQKEMNVQKQARESQKENERKQAENLLEEYQENEEPKKLLSYVPKKIDDRPVFRDW
jgi:Ca-activated chloride channel family protein